MGKKIPLLLSTITMLVGSIAPGGYAWADDRQGWTFEEIHSFSKEVEEKRYEYCKDNPEFQDFSEMCYWEYKWEGEDQEKYEAAKIFLDLPLHVTAFNPTEKYAKVYFSGEDLMSKHMGWSDDYTLEVNHLYLSQQNRENRTDCAYRISQGLDAPTCNLLFHSSESESGRGWIPAGQETTIPISELSFAPEKSRAIEATLVSTSGVRWVVGVRLHTCLESPDYREGMECQARFPSDDAAFYVPVEPKELESSAGPVEPTEPTEPIESSEPSDTSDQTNMTSGEEFPIGNHDTTNECNMSDNAECGKGGITTEEPITDVEGIERSRLSAPDTGAPTKENEGTIEFPWWLGVVFGLGLVALIWFFLPSKRR